MTLLAASSAAAGSEESPVKAVPGNSQAEEIYLSFTFSGLVNTVITALYLNDSVYIPVSAVFKQLRVDNSLDLRSKTLKGFYTAPSDKYQIDFAAGVARIGGKEIRFDTSTVIAGQLDFYALPSFFRKIFGLNFSVDFSSLSLSLTTDQKLPIVEDYKRQIRRRYELFSPTGNLLQAPLAFPRKRNLLNGGVLDYSLSAYDGAGRSNYNYELTGGAEILGGETQGSVLGAFVGNTSSIYSSTFSWKYAVDSSAYLTYAALGNLSSDGLTSYGYRGAQISNEPLAVRTLFGEYTVRAQTSPNWDVDLYVNGQFVGYKRADAQGKAEFSIPLVYGTSFIQLKYYGPNGEFNETDRRLQIPFSFVPAGQVNYTISGGKLNNTDYNFLSGNVAFGVTDWMSDKIGMDYLDSPLFSKPLLYNSLYLRLGSEYTMSIDAAPSAFYRSTFNALYASQAAFDVMYTQYRQNLLYNPSMQTQQVQADAYLPFSIGSTNFNFRMAGNAQEFMGGQKSYSYSGYFSTSLSQLNASIGYLKSIIDYGSAAYNSYSLTGTILYSFFFRQGPFNLLNGTLLNVNGRYGVLKNSLDNISFQLTRNIQQYIQIAFSAERDYINRATTFNLQIIADLPFTRSTTSAQFHNRSGYYTENVSGSVGFDSNYGKFLFNDLGWVGHSAASIRMFVDANGNGKYDEGEKVIREGNVPLRQAVSTERSNDGIIRDWNLLPYTQYSADVDINSIRNPLWIPEKSSFSFITDPDSYKKIDVPFFVGGVIDGHVLKSQDGKLSAISGLTLELKSVSGEFNRSITVFYDGSFYYMGLPPGRYEAYVDSSQLAVLGVYSDPAKLLFDVKPTKNGDYVEGLKIILRDRKPQESAQSKEKPPAETLIRTSAKSSRPAGKSPARNAVVPQAQTTRSVVIPARFSVQIGSFKSRGRATLFAEEARARTGMEFGAHFNVKLGLYVVQTKRMDGKEGALNVLRTIIRQTRYRDAFIVSSSDQGTNYLFSIQVAAFHSMTAAKEYSSRILKENGMQSIVQFGRSTQLFSVMIGLFNSRRECEEAADTLKKTPGYSGAFVTVYGLERTKDLFTVLLGTFLNHNSAVNFAAEFQRRTGLTALIDFDNETMKFMVITPTYQTRAEASAALKLIQAFEGYSSSRLISLP